MKRRVLRAHANKRNLRILSAEHGLRLDTYNVLCDASFVRAMAVVAAADGGGGQSPAHVLKALMYDTFAAATSHVAQSGDGNGASRGASPKTKAKDLAISLFFLPETAVALRRMIEKQHSDGKMVASSKMGRKNGTEMMSATSAKRGRGEAASDVIEALLVGLECVGHVRAEANRNESKAIARFVTEAAEGQVRRECSSMHVGKNAHFFFIATQSHDVRRLLPGHAALIRLTTSPTALWIERNGDAFRYDGTGGAVGSSRPSDGPAPVVKKELSAADVAFMRHLSADLVPDRGVSKRRRVEKSNDGRMTTTMTAEAPTGGQIDSRATNSTVRGELAREKKTRFRRKGVRAPNPLSVKKKRVREVFRVDSMPACGGRK